MAVRLTPETHCRSLRHQLCALLLPCALCAAVSTAALAAPSGDFVNYTVKVLTPAATPEVYNTPTGLAQWRSGLPVPSQDTIQVVAAIGSGDVAITGISAKIDGKPVAEVPGQTWTESVSATNLSLGDHVVDVTTTTNKHGINATLPLKFTVVQSMPTSMIPPVPPVVSAVKGAQQVLNQGNVASFDPAATAIVPPVVSNSAKLNNDPGVTVVLPTDSATAELNAGQPVTVNGSMTVEVVPTQGSTDANIVFSVVRDGVVVASSSSLIPMSGAGIRLQAHSGNSTGLFPGPVKLYVWGIDQSGNYSTPAIVNFIIKDNLTPVMTKP